MKTRYISFFFLSMGIAHAFAQSVPANFNKPVTGPAPVGTVSIYPDLNNLINTSNRNFIRSYFATKPLQNINDINNGDIYSSLASTSYVDGLGRPLQEVNRRASANAQVDLIKVHTYDNMGREATNYPDFDYFDSYGNLGGLKTSPYSAVTSTFNNAYPGEAPYGTIQYEHSPLNRPLFTMKPGLAWVGSNRGTSISYGTNFNIAGSDMIAKWNIGYQVGDLPTFNGFYASYELFSTTTTDEDGHISMVYKDKFGRKVCEKTKTGNSPIFLGYVPGDWLQTYYIYDDLGYLRFVMSPEAVNASMQGNWLYNPWVVDQGIADGLCYQYKYDGRGRLTDRKLPGKEIEYFIYDGKDRLVLYQDGVLRNYPSSLLNFTVTCNSLWQYTLYDEIDRPVATGLWSNCQYTRDDLPNQVLYTSNQTNALIDYIRLPAAIGYPDPIDDCIPLVFTYYDSYDYLSDVYDPSYVSQLTGVAPYAVQPQQSLMTRGLITGTKVRVLAPSGFSVPWITTINFYDDKGRIIQERKNNIKGGYDVLTNQYDFSGTLISSVNAHNNPVAISIDPANPAAYQNQTVVKRYTRNYVTGKMMQLEQNINGTGWRSIYANQYDRFNRLMTKFYGPTSAAYRYNINGWLTSINKPYLDKGAYPTMPSDIFFAEQINYDNGFTSQLYNGNIAGIVWRNSGASTPRSYGYTYDNANRLTYANFNEYINTGTWYWGIGNTDLTASNISYDNNGNILTMNQKGPGQYGPVDMDLLTYQYNSNSNQIDGVKDDGDVTTNPDFKDDNGGGNHFGDYTYDANGNLTLDNNKGLTILNNYLNKPVQITQGSNTINKIYDATGNLLEEDFVTNGQNTNRYFIDDFIYEDDVLKSIQNEEGRCRPILGNTSNVATFTYDYYLKDHLGNVRTVINSEAYSGSGYNQSPAGQQLLRQYVTGMEVSSANTESLIWSHLDDVRTDKPGSTVPTDTKAAELNATDPHKRIGPALMLRVMAGDQFGISANSYYDAIGNDELISTDDIVSSLFTALAGGSSHTGIPTQEVPENMNVINGTIGGGSFPSMFNNLTFQNYDNTMPATFINYVLFDEEMRPVAENSGTIQIGGAPSQWNYLGTMNNIIVSRNGYLATWVSTLVGSPSFVDDVDVTLYRGNLLEENHYYPFGLTLSSESGSNKEYNSFKLNGKRLQSELDLNWYDYGARQYDMQIGRWLSLDPKSDKYFTLSPFSYCANNPAKFLDPDGKQLYISTENNAYVLAEMQKLTNDKLARNAKTGEIYIAHRASKDLSKPAGTQLIRDLIEHTHKTTVNYSETKMGSGTDYPNDAKASNGGTDVTVTFTKNNGAAQYDVNGETQSLQQKSYIVLGGELIHSLVAMDGNKSTDGTASHTYTNVFGEPQTEVFDRNEYATHGIGKWHYNPSIYRQSYPSENDLRKENGEPKRVSYEDDINYKYKPDNKEKLDEYEKKHNHK